MSKTSEKISVFAKKVLDLTNRNRLIKYKPSKSGSFKLSDDYPILDDLYNSLVENNVEITYSTQFTVSEIDDEELQLLEDVLDTTDDEKIADRTRRLESTRKKIKEAESEFGYNIGYIAIGFLEWYESDSSSDSTISPLLLVPITILRASKYDPFVISFNQDEEISFNNTLIKKLEDEFGLQVPNFSLYNDGEKKNFVPLKEIFTFIENEILSFNPKWSLKKEAYVDVFSFLTQAIYNDLLNNSNLIELSQFIKALCDDEEIINDESDIQDIQENIDKISSENFLQILDADSSQQIALQMARNGYSFVIQGPPGTGKSQTITNIIAEGIGQNKKILFVSEKQAALNVVYDKLKRYGLSDFVLSLHNRKQSKSDIRQQLQKSVDLANQKTKIQDSAFLDLKNLDRIKLSLNEYAKELHKIISPMNKNAFYANGQLSKLEPVDDVFFDTEFSINEISWEKYNDLIVNISEYVNSIGETTISQKNNVWQYLKKDVISNNQKTQLQNTKKIILDDIKNIIKKEEKFEQLLNLNEFSIDDYQQFSNMIDKLREKPLTTRYAVLNPLLNDDNLNSNISYVNKLAEIGGSIDSLSSTLKIETIETVINDEISHLKKSLDFPYINDSENVKSFDSKITEDIKSILDRKSDLENKLFEMNIKIKDINNIPNNIIDIHEKLQKQYNNIFKRIGKSYKLEKNVVTDLIEQENDKTKYDRLILITNVLCAFYDIKIELMTLSKKFGFDYDNIEIISKINKVHEENINKVSKLRSLYNLVSNMKAYNDICNNLSKTITNFIADKDYLKQDELLDILKYLKWLQALKETSREDAINEMALDSFDKVINEVIEVYNSIQKEHSKILDDYHSLNELIETNLINVSEIKIFFENMDFSRLEEWIYYATSKQKVLSIGLSDFISKIEAKEYPSEDVLNIFEKRFWKLWIDENDSEIKSIINFSSEHQKSLITDFKELDRRQMEIAKSRIKSNLINHLPNFQIAFNTKQSEIGILLNELKKRRNLLPTRKLIEKLPTLLPTLKPCMMMSPLTVSTYFGTNLNHEFDIVIFDEASQVKPEFAIPAIARGKQLIVAGDSKQMPPTNFFDSFHGNSDDYDDESQEMVADDLESILDEMSNLLLDTDLRWHYRSKDESLITFSNKNFYNNRLFTFPGAVDFQEKPFNIEFHHVKDGQFVQRKNEKEAEFIAKLIFELFDKYPDKSIGVVAFGIGQSQIIEQKIMQLREANPEYEEFFNENKDEEFFVKNLENIQGDERDIIVLSIGYAPNADGKMSMSFGPLSRDGGERRLNVAVSRSKEKMIIVSSIKAANIKTDGDSVPVGRKLLRDFIDYAEHGYYALLGDNYKLNEETEFDSDFELAVYDFLLSKGYKVRTQVGASGYKIDLAILHPEIDGRFVLAVECDGAAYHSSLTARDRDRLRQNVLENIGWRFYRIWSTSWANNPKKEQEKLIDAIEESIQTYGTDNYLLIEEKNDFEEQIIISEETDNINNYAEVLSCVRKKLSYNAWSGDTIDPRYIFPQHIEQAILIVLSKQDIVDKETLLRIVNKGAFLKTNLSSIMRSKIERSLTNLNNKMIVTIANDTIKADADKLEIELKKY